MNTTLPAWRPRSPPLSAAAVAVMLGWATSVAAPPEISEEDLDIAVKRAVEYLWSRQNADGGWEEEHFAEQYAGGVAALTTYALLEAGQSPHDPRMVKAVAYLQEIPNLRTTYARSFRALVWSRLDADKFRKQRNEDATFLVRSQHKSGGWGYPGSWGGNTADPWAAEWVDNSNTQIAMLAAWAASVPGSEIPRSLWRAAEDYWVGGQNADGGWGYHMTTGSVRDDLGSYGSMTAAGLATLYIIYDQLHAADEGKFTGRGAPKCGQHVSRAKDLLTGIEAAARWLSKNFTLGEVAGTRNRHANRFLGYYHYSIDRAGVASGRKYLADKEWYPLLAREVLSRQQQDGSWGGLVETSFSLLALLRGRAPIIINKLQYAGEDWNNDPRDVAKLSEWMSRVFERSLGWQTVELHTPSDLLDAPILFLNGHEGPDFGDADRKALVNYVWEGGTIVAMACCSRGKFAKNCLSQFREMFPGLRVAPLEDDHSLYQMQYRPRTRLPITGLSDGCRTRIFIFQQDLCCAWHQGGWADHRELFEVGANLYLYATAHARQQSRLRPMFARPSPTPFEVRVVGRARYDGDWQADPRAVEHLSAAMAEAFGLGLREEVVELSVADPTRTALLWITGHDDLQLTEAQAEGLKRFIRQGGTVLVDAGCGRQRFDKSFRKLAAGLFGEDALQPLPPDHPLLSGALAGPLGADVRVARYKRDVLTSRPGLRTPELATLRTGRSPGLVYSRYGLACPCDGHPCVDCFSYEVDTARAMVANLIMAADRSSAAGPAPQSSPTSPPPPG